jgi:hypothetical protein
LLLQFCWASQFTIHPSAFRSTSARKRAVAEAP